MNVKTVEPEQPTAPFPALDAVGRVGAVPRRAVTEPEPHLSLVRACATGAAGSLVLALIGRFTGIEAVALVGGYGVLFLGIGAAPFQLRPGLSLYARLTGTVIVGFAALLLSGAAMADIRHLWSPVVCLILLGIPAVWLHVEGLRRLRRAGDLTARTEALDAVDPFDELDLAGVEGETLTGVEGETLAGATPRPRRLAGMLPAPDRLAGQLLLVGTVFWLGTAIATRDPHPGYWGMLATINRLWYVGLVIVLVGFVIGRRSELTAGLGALSFGLATTLTPALVYGAPREPTAAKQMEITQWVLVHHHIHVTAGIYPAFSSFFAGIAAFSQLLGIHGLLGHMSLWGIATYWPVLLVPMRIVTLRFLAGRLLPTTARRWSAVMLVLLVDSLGNDYFSPQSVGYVLAIAAVAVGMNGLRARPFSNRGTVVLLLLCGISLAPTHELSPYMAAGALIVLLLFGQAPWWSWAPVTIPALLWAGLVHKAISQNFNFASLFNLSNFRPPVTVATKGLTRLPVVGIQSHVLLLSLLLLMALAAIGFLPHIRRRWAWGYALCPAVGIALIAINPYGNEGIFRATLFAIPWMAVLAMLMPHPSRLIPALRRPLFLGTGIALTLTTLLATFLIAAYAMDGTMVLPPGNVAVVSYLMHQPPQGAYVLAVGSASNPADGANFSLDYRTLEWSQIVQGAPALQRSRPTLLDAAALADRYGLYTASLGVPAGSPLYLIWDRLSRQYANAYGLQSTAQLNQWLRVLLRSPSWELVDRSGGTYLFQLT